MSATVYLCPLCGEEDLRPAQDVPGGGWHCLSCLAVFTVTVHGRRRPTPPPVPAGARTPSTPPGPRDHGPSDVNRGADGTTGPDRAPRSDAT